MQIRSLALLVSSASLLFLGGCSGEAKDTHPDQLVTKRKAVFKEFTKTLEPIGMVARGRKDYKPLEFKTSALELQRLSSQPWSLFTADSNYPPTLAKPAVWDKPGEFKQAQDQFQQAVAGLVQASEGSDLDSIKTAVDRVQRSCKGCHDAFRNER
jgi:cytochrome c556